jgi:hypothetical protein
MNNLSLVVYTHSSYKDCWNPFVNRFEQHCNFHFNKSYFVLDQLELVYGYPVINYSDEKSYTERLVEVMLRIDTDYVFFLHEDMIMYDDINMEYFQEAVDTIVNDDVDCIKLIKADDNYQDTPYKDSKVLKSIPLHANMLFAVQPTLWNKESFIKVLRANRGKNIWQLEASGQSIAKKNRYNCLYAYDPSVDKKRGKYHYDSCTFPYIATAIEKGKWNTTGYPKEMIELAQEFNIDFSKRGTK